MPSTIHSKDSCLFTISDMAEWKPPSIIRIIHKGIFNVHNRMFIFGDEGSWKSILTIHTGVCLANGTDWLGFRTSQCNVLKLQVELPQYSDFDRTIKYSKGHEKILSAKLLHNCKNDEEKASLSAWIHQQANPPNIVSRTDNFIHLDESFGIESLKKNIEVCLTNLPSPRPLVVIVDPLYMLVGGDPNKGDDMKKLLNNINLSISHFQNKGFDIAFIIVHHMKKPDVDDTGRPVNGGSNDQSGTRDFQKWADTVIRLDLDPLNSKRVSMRFTKHRNAEEDLPDLEFKWNRETLHPQITARYIRHDPKDDEEVELRGEDLYRALES